ncbi:glycoside hydrolase family 3 N-terminal domain-containing protein [Streptomyces sp. NPDC001262]|uniref:glycoside hydrolase family 3 N-terminal domain-containing protein n=1 Tax=Streptomyces sp. NPDC001262 TaxID=3364552 RepID=UPI0036A1CAA1
MRSTDTTTSSAPPYGSPPTSPCARSTTRCCRPTAPQSGRGPGPSWSTPVRSNGVPATASRYLLTTVLWQQWGFIGVTVSDWQDIRALRDQHKVAADYPHAVALAIGAGVDMAMEPYESREFSMILRGTPGVQPREESHPASCAAERRGAVSGMMAAPRASCEGTSPAMAGGPGFLRRPSVRDLPGVIPGMRGVSHASRPPVPGRSRCRRHHRRQRCPTCKLGRSRPRS